MTIRRLSAYLPLAAVVGAGVHVAATGFAHAPGGNGALAFLGSLAATLTFALAAIFAAGALGTLRPSIATKPSRVYGLVATLGLAIGGTAVFGLIEALEGHVGLGGLARALLASFPTAWIVIAISRRAAEAAIRAGTRFAAEACAKTRFIFPRHVATRRRRTHAHGRLLVAAARGRAPPLAF